MKKFLIAALTLSSLSAFAHYDVATTIAEIERNSNAVCSKVSQSRFSICSGGLSNGNIHDPRPLPATRSCYYNVTFKCLSNEGDFKVKLRVKEGPDLRTGRPVSRVVKVTYRR
jgi:hypothetical protein